MVEQLESANELIRQELVTQLESVYDITGILQSCGQLNKEGVGWGSKLQDMIGKCDAGMWSFWFIFPKLRTEISLKSISMGRQLHANWFGW